MDVTSPIRRWSLILELRIMSLEHFYAITGELKMRTGVFTSRHNEVISVSQVSGGQEDSRDGRGLVAGPGQKALE